jgi:hypothetical protein
MNYKNDVIAKAANCATTENIEADAFGVQFSIEVDIG